MAVCWFLKGSAREAFSESFSWLRCCCLSQLLKGLKPKREREKGQCGSIEGSKARVGSTWRKKLKKGGELFSAVSNYL